MRKNILTLVLSLTVLDFAAFQSFALVPPPDSLRSSRRHEQVKPADPDTTVTVTPKSAFYLSPAGNGLAFYLPTNPTGDKGLAFYLPTNPAGDDGLAFYLPTNPTGDNGLAFYLPTNPTGDNGLAFYLPTNPAQA
jgi:hypothetical protein